MPKCGSCGSKRMKRVHRTFWERFTYLAIYECGDCHSAEPVPRLFRYRLAGDFAMCPRCGTLRITKLRDRDRIDPMERGFLNFIERIAGGQLYHCCYCRVQFYDRRKIGPRPDREAPGTPSESVPAPQDVKQEE